MAASVIAVDPIAGEGVVATHEFPAERALPLCTDVSAFWLGPITDFRAAVLNFYETSVAVVGSNIKWFKTETMSRARPMTREALDLLPFWLSDERARRQIATLDFGDSDDPDWPSDKALTVKIFSTAGLEAGACRLVLPADTGLETPDRFYDVARRLVMSSNFAYALAGFSVNWDPISPHARQAEALFPYVAARFAGVDIPALTGTVLALREGIKCINWMTFLGKALWETLGIETEELQIREDIDVEPCLAGVLITAGRRPVIGDRYRLEGVQAYRVVGSKLSPIRAHSHPPILPAGRDGDDEARTESWLGRFDAEPEAYDDR
jgi:hypothetical protein